MLSFLAEVRTSVAELRLCSTGGSFEMERSIEFVGYSLDLRVKFFMGHLDGKASALLMSPWGDILSLRLHFFKTGPILQISEHNSCNWESMRSSRCISRSFISSMHWP